MNENQKFYKTVLNIALPVTLQSLLQSSFSVVDQIMTGQLGSTSIAGIGLAGKFASIFSVLVSAIAAAAGIMIAQYIGKQDSKEVSRSFFVNLFLAMGLAVLFTVLCCLFPKQIMGLYTKGLATKNVAAGYLRILAASYLPMAIGTLFSTLLRCMEAAALPMYASVFAAVINTGLNYILIFGKCGFPRMGVTGAALATVISQGIGCLMIFGLFLQHYRKQELKLEFFRKKSAAQKRNAAMLGDRYQQERLSEQPIYYWSKSARMQYIGVLLPILICEFLWSLGENVYAAIYGRVGTQACAAMTLTTPIQVLLIGALSGLSQAAGVMIGKALGSGEEERAYCESKKLMWYGFGGSVILSAVLILFSRIYVEIYQVEDVVRVLAKQILFAFAVISPVKVQNMILGGGIIRSGGKTKYVMWIDFIGTWIFGVPLGLVAAFVWKLSIPWVYFILSLEECVRFVISLAVFKRKKWMNQMK